MDDGEVVTADTSYGLGKEDDIAILDTCRSQLRYPTYHTSHILTRYVSIGLLELLDLLGGKVLLDPLL